MIRRRGFRGALVALAILLAGAGIAYAHATLVSSEPPAGGSLRAAPARVRLVFSEPIEPKLGEMSLIDGGGVTTHLVAAGDPTDVHAVIATVPPLDSGAYRVVWRIVSADGHPVSGNFVFTIAADSASPPPPEPPPAPASMEHDFGPMLSGAAVVPALFRGLAVGVLMALFGLLTCMTLDDAPGSRAPAGGRLAMGLAVAAPVLLLAHAITWMYHTSSTHQLSAAWIQSTWDTAAGKSEAMRIGLSIGVLWALALARRQGLALLFAAAAMVVSGAIGHSAALSPAVSIPFKVVHLVGAGIWLGGLLWLITARRDDPARFVAAAGRVSSLALVSVAVVGISGVVVALLFLAAPHHLLEPGYGRIVLAKVAGLGVLIAFGAYHRFRLLPRLSQLGVASDLRRSLRREVAVMSVVVLLGGLLAYVPPENEEHDHDAAAPGAAVEHVHESPTP